MTTFYLAKNDHRWITFISLKTINSRAEVSDLTLSEYFDTCAAGTDVVRGAKAWFEVLGFGDSQGILFNGYCLILEKRHSGAKVIALSKIRFGLGCR